MTADLLRRYPFPALLGIYCATLLVLHALGLFPRPGLNDISNLIGSAQVTFEGRVVDVPSIRWEQTRFVLEGAAIPLAGFHGRVLVTLPFFDNEVGPGDRVRVRGWLSPMKDKKGAFDERRYWSNQRVFAKLRVWSSAGYQREPVTPYHLHYWGWQFHQRFRRFWEAALDPIKSSLLLGITLGGHGILSPSLKDACIRAGVYHIVVVSGQSMSLIIGLGLALLRLMGLPRRWALLVCVAPVIFYTVAVGADPPVVRAATMALIGLFVSTLRRDVPRLYPLYLAAGWILIREPEALLGASFQLSFGATASLLLLWTRKPPNGSESRIKRWWKEAATVAFTVHVGVWPLLVYYFHRISVMGFLANWTIFPLAGLVLVCGLVVGSIGVLHAPAVPNFVLLGMSKLIGFTLWGIHQLGGSAWAVIPVPHFEPWLGAVYYGGLFGILFLIHRRKTHAESPHSLPQRRNRLSP